MTRKTTLFGSAALTLVLTMTAPALSWAQYGDYVTGNSVDVDLSVLDSVQAPQQPSRTFKAPAGDLPDTIIISSDTAGKLPDMPDSRINPSLSPMSPVAAAPAPFVSQPQEISAIPAPVPAESIGQMATAEPQVRVLKPEGTATVRRKRTSNEFLGIKATGAPVTYPRSEDSMAGSYRPSLKNDQYEIITDEREAKVEEPRRVLKKKVASGNAPRPVLVKPAPVPTAAPRLPDAAENAMAAAAAIPPGIAPVLPSAELDRQMQAIDRSMSLLAPNAQPSAPVNLPPPVIKTKLPPPPLPVQAKPRPMPKAVPAVTPAPVKTVKPVAAVPAAAPFAAAAPVFKPTAKKATSLPDITPPPSAATVSTPVAEPLPLSTPAPSSDLLGTQLPISAPASAPVAPPVTVTTKTTTTVEEKNIDPIAKKEENADEKLVAAPVAIVPAPQPPADDAVLVDKTAAAASGPVDLSVPPPFVPVKEDTRPVYAAPAPRPVPVEAPVNEDLVDKTSSLSSGMIAAPAPAPKALPTTPILPGADMISQPVTAPEKVMAAATPASAINTAAPTLATAPAADTAGITPPPGQISSAIAAPAPLKMAEQKTAPATKTETAATAASKTSNMTLEFEGDKTAISAADQAAIKKTLADVPANAERISIAAYATGNASDAASARKISLARSLAVRTFLMDNGIKPARIDVRALGNASDKKPLDRVEITFPQ